MAGPSFLQFAQATPGGALPGALQSGMSTYGALEQMQQKKAAAERAAKMGTLKQQAAQLSLDQAPAQAKRAAEGFLTNQKLKHAQIQHLTDIFVNKNPVAIAQLGQKYFEKNPNSPEARALADFQKGIGPKNGIQIGTNKQGGMSVSIGGQGGAGSQVSQAGASPFGNPVVNPMTKAARGSKGATYIDTETGKKYSTPTLGQTGKLQQRVLGEVQTKNLVDGMTKKLHKIDFFNYGKQLKYLAAPFGLKMLDPEASQIYSDFQTVHDLAKEGANSVLSMGNLPKVKETYDDLVNIMTPKPHETEKSYRSRIDYEVAIWEKTAKAAKKALDKGHEIGEAEFKSVKLAPKSYMDLVHPQFIQVHNPNYKGAAQNAPVQQAPAQNVPAQQALAQQPITDEAVQATAAKYGMTPDEVINRLKEKGIM